MTDFCPRSKEELAAIVTEAAAEKRPLGITGGGSKQALGRAEAGLQALSLAEFSGILAYEPAELVLTARAATPLADIEAILRNNNQMLAFEPADWRGLLQSKDKEQTIGGILACNIAGPRRITAGAARDHFLGFEAVNGCGEIFKAGGKVVKNVTGYDLCKVIAGSYGTLALLTDITVKVMPRPETSCSVFFHDLDDAAAIRLLTQGLNSVHEPSGAAHIPAAMSRDGRAVTVLRLEGHGPSVVHRRDALIRDLKHLDPAGHMDQAASEQLWADIRNADFFTDRTEQILWRLSVTPSKAPAVVAAISAALACRWFYDWGGGLIWIAHDDGLDASVIRQAIAQAAPGGHATIMRAPRATRALMDVFNPLPAPILAITRQVKAAFDPHGILNPGRLYNGF